MPRRVSVLVNTYDRPELLRLALRSILVQTYEDFDVLVWNDGGPRADGVVSELADERVRYHHNDRNEGVMQAVAGGMRATSGELIAHMDDDDEWDPGFLAAHVRLLDVHPTAAVAFCDHAVMSADGIVDATASDDTARRWGRLELAPGLHRPAFEIAFGGTIPMASAAVVRRSALDLDDVPAEMSFAWDLWVSYLATRSGAGVAYEPRRLSRKRRHARQMMSAVAPTSNLTDLVIVCERLWREPSFAVDRERLARRLADASANWSIALLRDGERDRARTAARRSLQVKPSPRGLAALIAASLPRMLGSTIARGASAAVARWRRLTRASLLGRGSY